MKKITQCFILVFCSLSIAFPTNQLTTNGQAIVNQTGDTIRLIGFGVGGWLQPEGYMWQIEQRAEKNDSLAALAPSQIRHKIEILVGKEKSDTFFREYEKNFFTEKDVQLLKAWGTNSIRLPINANRLMPPELQPAKAPYMYKESEFAIIDSVVAWCEKNQMYLILDMHCSPGGQTSDHIADPIQYNVAGLWDFPEVYWDQTKELWDTLSMRYKGREWVAGYELINEPSGTRGGEFDDADSAITQLTMDLCEIISVNDPDHLIFIQGYEWATRFEPMVSSTKGHNRVYTFHLYWEDDIGGSDVIKNVSNQGKVYNVPFYCGETGENTTEWGEQMVKELNSRKYGWNWWTVKKVDDQESCPFSIPMTSGFSKIVDWLANAGAKPDSTEAVASLMEFARSVTSDSLKENGELLKVLELTYQVSIKGNAVKNSEKKNFFTVTGSWIPFSPATYGKKVAIISASGKIVATHTADNKKWTPTVGAGLYFVKIGSSYAGVLKNI